MKQTFAVFGVMFLLVALLQSCADSEHGCNRVTPINAPVKWCDDGDPETYYDIQLGDTCSGLPLCESDKQYQPNGCDFRVISIGNTEEANPLPLLSVEPFLTGYDPFLFSDQVAYSPGGNLVAVCDGALHVYTTDTRQLVRKFSECSHAIFNAKGDKLLVWLGSYRIFEIDILTGDTETVYDDRTSGTPKWHVYAQNTCKSVLAFSIGKRVDDTGNDYTTRDAVRFIDARDYSVIADTEMLEGEISDIVFMGDGKTAIVGTWSDGSELYEVDIRSGKSTRIEIDHGGIADLDVSPDGRFLAVCANSGTWLLNTSDYTVANTLRDIRCRNGISFGWDSETVWYSTLIGKDYNTAIWDRKTESIIGTVEAAHGLELKQFVKQNNGQYIFGLTREGTLLEIDMQSYKPTRLLSPVMSFSDAAISDDGKTVVGVGSALKKWTIKDGVEAHLFNEPELNWAENSQVVLREKDNLILAFSGVKLKSYSLDTLERLDGRLLVEGIWHGSTLSGDGRWAAFHNGETGEFRFIHTETGESRSIFDDEAKKKPYNLHLSQDGGVLVAERRNAEGKEEVAICVRESGAVKHYYYKESASRKTSYDTEFIAFGGITGDNGKVLITESQSEWSCRLYFVNTNDFSEEIVWEDLDDGRCHMPWKTSLDGEILYRGGSSGFYACSTENAANWASFSVFTNWGLVAKQSRNGKYMMLFNSFGYFSVVDLENLYPFMENHQNQQ